MSGAVFFLGLGYSVQPLAEALVAEGTDVWGTTRDEAKAARLGATGINMGLWEAGAVLPPDLPRRPVALIVSVSPGEDGCPGTEAVRAAVAAGRLTLTRILYLSSTGVYGDHDGAWVDETTPTEESTERGAKRLAAEAGWQSLAEAVGVPLTLCRLAGIYGPGRNALESLSGQTRGAKAGLTKRIIKPGQVFNRIHRDDIAGALRALLHAASPPDIVNFADDEPSPPQDVLTYAAELLGQEPPPEVPFEQADLSPMARSFYADNKRLVNERLKALPGFRLRYPTYREGLQAIAADLKTPSHDVR